MSKTSAELQYHAVYHRQENGWYVVKVLDFPGALSQGRTLKSAQRMIRDALRLLAESTIEEGQPLPPPDPTAEDENADFQEVIPLRIRAQTGAAV